MRNAGLWAFALGCYDAYPLLRARIEIRIRGATTETHTAMPTLAVLLASITLSSTSLSRDVCREVSKRERGVPGASLHAGRAQGWRRAL